MPLSDTERGWGEVLLILRVKIQRHLWLVLMKEIEGAASQGRLAIINQQAKVYYA